MCLWATTLAVRTARVVAEHRVLRSVAVSMLRLSLGRANWPDCKPTRTSYQAFVRVSCKVPGQRCLNTCLQVGATFAKVRFSIA